MGEDIKNKRKEATRLWRALSDDEMKELENEL